MDNRRNYSNLYRNDTNLCATGGCGGGDGSVDVDDDDDGCG